MSSNLKRLISDLRAGFIEGSNSALIETEAAPKEAHDAIEELLAEGFLYATPWQTHLITKERYRIISTKPLLPNEKVRKNEHNS